MTMTDPSPRHLPTADDVRRWREELDRVIAEEVAMKARHAAAEKQLNDWRTRLEGLVSAGTQFVEAAMANLPRAEAGAASSSLAKRVADVRQDAEPRIRPERRTQQRPRTASQTWTATILRTVNRAGRGITQDELRDELRSTHLGKTLARTDKAFYGGIYKLIKSSHLVKHNGRLYTPAVYGQFMEDVTAGRAVDEPAPPAASRMSDNKRAINTLLSQQLNGPTTSEIIDALYNSPPKGLEISSNKTVIYNLLSKMKQRRELIVRDGRHYLPAQLDGTPGSSEPGVSKDHHVGRGGTLSSSGNGRSPPASAHPGAIPAQPGE